MTSLPIARSTLATESEDWLSIFVGLPSAQAPALDARGYGRTGVLFFQNACESRCFFCAAPGGVNAPAPDDVTPDARVRTWLDDARSVALERILIGGTEPVLHPSFGRALEVLAAEHPGVPIELMTSGLRLSDGDAAARLRALGVTTVAVPLYAADPSVHDAIVGTPGAHERVTCGLDAARAAGIEVLVHTLAVDRVLPGLGALAALTRARWGTRLAIGVSRPKAGVWSWKDESPTFDVLARAIEGLDVALVGLPLCIAPSHPRDAARTIELYFRTTRTTYGEGCGACSLRSRCPGVLAEELARGAVLTPRP